MRGIRFTKKSGPQLLAGYGIPVLTQAVWTARKEPETSTCEEASPSRRTGSERTDRGAKDTSEAALSLRVLDKVGRFPAKRATMLVLWGLILVLTLPFAFTALGGKGATKNAAASSGRGAPASGLEAAAGRTHGAPAGTAKEISAAVEEKRQDHALEVLQALSCDEFASPEEVATGRFLAELSDKIPYVRGMDLDSLSVVARGPRWARLEARYRPSKPWFEKQEEEQILILDLVEEDAQWKLEDLRVAPKRNS